MGNLKSAALGEGRVQPPVPANGGRARTPLLKFKVKSSKLRVQSCAWRNSELLTLHFELVRVSAQERSSAGGVARGFHHFRARWGAAGPLTGLHHRLWQAV